MSERDRTLIETTAAHRDRLTAAFVHGPLLERRKVPTNIGRILGSVILAAVLGLGCLGTSFVIHVIEDRRDREAIAAFQAAAASNPLKPGQGAGIGLVEDEATGLLHRPSTGEYVDPQTGFVVDPTTMLATDPQGRLVDTRLDWYYDPATGYYTDPSSGITIDPRTLTVVEEP